MIVLVGASASGKTEVARVLKNKYGLTKIVTHTTRPMRDKEVDHVDYHFVSIEKFLDLKAQNFFVETTEYNGNYYGTSKKEIEDNKVLVVDPNGLHAFVALGDHRIITFFMNAAETTREKRMLLRGDSPEAIAKRLENDRLDFSFNNVGRTDYVIDTEKINVEEVADAIYKLYISRLSSIGY
jgi:guanylate kinase